MCDLPETYRAYEILVKNLEYPRRNRRRLMEVKDRMEPIWDRLKELLGRIFVARCEALPFPPELPYNLGRKCRGSTPLCDLLTREEEETISEIENQIHEALEDLRRKFKCTVEEWNALSYYDGMNHYYII